MSIKYISKDNDYARALTTYWFEVNEKTYGVTDSESGAYIVDVNGERVDVTQGSNAHVRELHNEVTLGMILD